VLTLKQRIESIDEEIRQRFFAPRLGFSVACRAWDRSSGPCFLVCVGDMCTFENADRVAAFAGLVPATRDSGKRVGNRRKMRGGNKTLKRVFYQSEFASLRGSAESRAFYDRKRREGKGTHMLSSSCEVG
jgi:hypothetical protein